MFFLYRPILILLSFLLLNIPEIQADQRNVINKRKNKYTNKNDLKKVNKYLLSDEHPLKLKLDQIFSRSRILADWESLQAAGFDALPPQHHTQIIVAKHPDLKGYVIKAYLDEQPYYKERPEYYHWINRIQGAQLIQKYLNQHEEYAKLFKVPQKWIYRLPDEPSPSLTHLRKNFILIAEDMELFDEKTNEALWASEYVTIEILDALYTITTDLGLRDSAKPSNSPFSADGKIAFIDTEVYQKEGVRFFKLDPYLSPQMHIYWKEMTQDVPSFSEKKKYPRKTIFGF